MYLLNELIILRNSLVMSTSETLKRQRTASKGRFTRTLNDLKRALDDEYYDIDVINSTFDDINESWKNVNSKHDDHMSSIKDDDDDNFLTGATRLLLINKLHLKSPSHVSHRR